MMAQIQCLRCGETVEALTQAPYPGETGQKILQGICPACWQAWQKYSVMVINDYKLKPFLPHDRSIVEQHMKQFLNLDGSQLPTAQTLTGQGKNVTYEHPLKARVIEMIEKIFDPEIPVNIYDLGLIYGIEVSPDNQVGIQMTLTTKHCPAAQSLPESVREAVKRIPGVKEVNIQMVWDPPWTKDRISPEGKEALGIES